MKEKEIRHSCSVPLMVTLMFLTAAFAVLKLFGIIIWSWLAVLFPLWLPIVLWTVVFFLNAAFTVIVGILKGMD